jgi:hypothetical protein
VLNRLGRLCGSLLGRDSDGVWGQIRHGVRHGCGGLDEVALDLVEKRNLLLGGGDGREGQKDGRREAHGGGLW